jgi:hypothetical protein
LQYRVAASSAYSALVIICLVHFRVRVFNHLLGLQRTDKSTKELLSLVLGILVILVLGNAMPQGTDNIGVGMQRHVESIPAADVHNVAEGKASLQVP